jgi:hypothetical protein
MRAFNPSWYTKFPWVEYSAITDKAFCFFCRHFASNNLKERAFCEGFSDWKHVYGSDRSAFIKHEMSESHRLAVAAHAEYILRGDDNTVKELVNSQHSTLVEENRSYLKKIVAAILFLGRQGLALRGNQESADSLNRGNFLELINYTAGCNEQFRSQMSQRNQNATYLSPETQNEFISIIGNMCIEMIAEELKTVDFFSLSADETKDTAHNEQLCITLRYLYNGKVKERFVGFHVLSALDAPSMAVGIVNAVKKIVPLEKCVSQVYDGASVMKGQKNGVNAIIRGSYPKAVYIHCRNHVLNLCLVDAVSAVEQAEDFFCCS